MNEQGRGLECKRDAGVEKRAGVGNGTKSFKLKRRTLALTFMLECVM